jgi:hypothetical protein
VTSAETTGEERVKFGKSGKNVGGTGSGYGYSGFGKGLGMPGWVPVPAGGREEGEMGGQGEEEEEEVW